ncbi:integrase, catalytic region, zinc finger, CCHC-type containing protein [Tanacetum coccineum]
MYKVKTLNNRNNTTIAKSVLPSTGLKAASIVRRPSNRDSPLKDSVLSNTKNSSEKVDVSVRTNKKANVASKNVVSNKNIVTDVDVKNALKAKDILCVSYAKNVVWSPIKTTPNVVNNRKTVNTSVPIKKWVAKTTTYPYVISLYVAGPGHNLFGVGQFCDGDLEVAFRSNTCYVRNLEGDDLLTGACEYNLYTISILDMAASSPVCLLSKATSTKSWLWHHRLLHLNFGTINDLTRHDLVDGLPKFKYSKDHLCSAEIINTPFEEDFDNLFGPMYEEYFEKRSSEVSINSATQQVQNHEDSPLTSSIIFEEHEAPPIVTTSDEQTSPISMNKDNELNQEDSADFNGNTIIVPYDALNFEEAKLTITALDPLNMHEFHQVQPSIHILTKAHPLEQVIGGRSKPVMTQNRLQTDSELCMYALTVSTLE